MFHKRLLNGTSLGMTRQDHDWPRPECRTRTPSGSANHVSMRQSDDVLRPGKTCHTTLKPDKKLPKHTPHRRNTYQTTHLV